MRSINWGAVVVGTAIGLGSTFVLFVAALIVGLAGRDLTGQAVLIFIQFLGQFVAGYAGGRFSAVAPFLHGSWAAMALWLITATLTLATGADVGVGPLLIGTVVAAVLGAAGGVLGGRPRRA